jgi:hypothetical protein
MNRRTYLEDILISPDVEENFKGILKDRPPGNFERKQISVGEIIPVLTGLEDFKFNETIRNLIYQLSFEVPLYRKIRGRLFP